MSGVNRLLNNEVAKHKGGAKEYADKVTKNATENAIKATMEKTIKKSK